MMLEMGCEKIAWIAVNSSDRAQRECALISSLDAYYSRVD